MTGTRRGAFLVAALALLSAAPGARADDPIMPLSEVRSGMDCRGLSVVRGTDIASFDVEVLDVVDGGLGARILVRTSGPAVDESGMGAGFSGSPVLCRDDRGVEKNAGAISEGLGDYGNRLALVTPIEAVLGTPVDPPVGASRLAPREGGRAPLRAPLTVAGLAPLTRRLASEAARRGGLPLIVSPAARPRIDYPPQELRPGASVAAGISSGDVGLSSIGTVTYVSGSSVWGFGHALDAAGRRSLLLQDAYVYTVVPNPSLALGGSYKLAAPGHDLGTLTSDSFDAIAGTLGTLPEQTTLRLHTRDLDRDTLRVSVIRFADETAVGTPAGASPFQSAGSFAVADAAIRALGSNPARQSASMCVRVRVAGQDRPLRFCNRYAVGGPQHDPSSGTMAFVLADDFARGTALIDDTILPGLRVESADVSMGLRRGVRQAVILEASAPRTVRRGRRVPVSLRVRVVRGPRRTLRFRLRVPHDAGRGRRVLRLTGAPLDSGEGGFGELVLELFEEPDTLDDPRPRTFGQLARRFRRIGRYDGVRAHFARPDEEEGGGPEGGAPELGRRAFRHPELRLTGQASVDVRVR